MRDRGWFKDKERKGEIGQERGRARERKRYWLPILEN